MNPAQIELCILLCLVYVSWGLTDSIQVKITTIFTHKNTIRDGGSPALYTAYTVFTVYTLDTVCSAHTVDKVYIVDMFHAVEHYRALLNTIEHC